MAEKDPLTQRLEELFLAAESAGRKASFSFVELEGNISANNYSPPHMIQAIKKQNLYHFNENICSIVETMPKLLDLPFEKIKVRAAVKIGAKVKPADAYIHSFMAHPIHSLILQDAHARQAGVSIKDVLRFHRPEIINYTVPRTEDRHYGGQMRRSRSEIMMMESFHYLDAIAAHLEKEKPEEKNIQALIIKNKAHITMLHTHYTTLGHAVLHGLKPQ